MTIPQIRRLVDSLMRKYADELQVHRLRPLAQEFCGDMADAITGNKPGPKLPVNQWAQIFFRRVRERGLRLQGLAHLNSYLERCLDLRVLPEGNEVLRALLPNAVRRGLIPRTVRQPIPF